MTFIVNVLIYEPISDDKCEININPLPKIEILPYRSSIFFFSQAENIPHQENIHIFFVIKSNHSVFPHAVFDGYFI